MVYTFVKPNKEQIKLHDKDSLEVKVGERVIIGWEEYIIEKISHELRISDYPGTCFYRTTYVVLKYEK